MVRLRRKSLMSGRFRASVLLDEDFSVIWELVPDKGANERAQKEISGDIEQVARDERVHAIAITDNPNGKPEISATYLGMDISKLGIEPLVHFTCKDKNRNQIQSELHAMAQAGISNLLVMTGDYPINGFKGDPKPVFDLDSIHVLQFINEMNHGLKVRSSTTMAYTNFFAGAVVSPFKREEAELITQYFKLQKKIEAGAKFIITQLGYDARKFHEILQYVQMKGWNVPVIANLYVLTYGVARIMNLGHFPGRIVTDELMKIIENEREAPDGGLEARLNRSAKMYAILKGMGFSGVRIGGHGLKYRDLSRIIEEGESLVSNWSELVHEFNYPQENGFYYFKKDESTKLNSDEPVDLSKNIYNKSLHHIFSLGVEKVNFNPKSIFFRPLRYLASSVDGSRFERYFTSFEHWIKGTGNHCMACGDCALLDLAYLCPMSQCPMNQRNGPCGGSLNGWCQVHPEKKCFYVRVYNRLKSYGEEETLASRLIPPYDWRLYHTSSWLNFYSGRDHSAERLGIKRHNGNE
jgi:methylenetetrahydrofolate reductase (NADPH)